MCVPVCLSEEMREYFGQFGSVKKCLLPFVSYHSVTTTDSLILLLYKFDILEFSSVQL